MKHMFTGDDWDAPTRVWKAEVWNSLLETLTTAKNTVIEIYIPVVL